MLTNPSDGEDGQLPTWNSQNEVINLIKKQSENNDQFDQPNTNMLKNYGFQITKFGLRRKHGTIEKVHLMADQKTPKVSTKSDMRGSAP